MTSAFFGVIFFTYSNFNIKKDVSRMLRKLYALVFVICFFAPGCTLLDKTHEKKLFTNTAKTKNVEKWQWKVKDGKTKPELKKGGIDVDMQFEQVELKDVVSLLMGIIKENYIIVDDLIGSVDIEIKGKFKRDEIIKMVRIVLNSKNYRLIKNGSLYGIHNNENLNDLNVQISPDDTKNVYLYRLQYESSENLKSLLNDVFPEITITENKSINVLIIKASIDDYQKVKDVIKTFDKRPKQVLVEFTIMEVTLNNALQYGVEYFFNTNNNRGGQVSLLTEGISSLTTGLAGKGLKAFTFHRDVNSFITILNSESKVEILSKPHVLVQDGQTSVIKIGRSEPIRKGTSVSENGLRSENIEYRDVGVILNVKVDVEENNVVKLYLSQEISDIIQTVQNPLIDSPSFTKNSLEMTTLINDGQKIYVGGLIENSTNRKVRKIPLLGDIPYLGKMFRSEDINKTKTELILLLSVEILFNEKDFENQRIKFVRKI